MLVLCFSKTFVNRHVVSQTSRFFPVLLNLVLGGFLKLLYFDCRYDKYQDTFVRLCSSELHSISKFRIKCCTKSRARILHARLPHNFVVFEIIKSERTHQNFFALWVHFGTCSLFPTVWQANVTEFNNNQTKLRLLLKFFTVSF